MNSNKPQNINPNRYVGAVVLSLFGAYWIYSWGVLVFGFSIPVLSVVVGLTTLFSGTSVYMWLLTRAKINQSQREVMFKFTYVVFWIVLAAEIFAIGFLTRELQLQGYSEWIPAGIIFVVGVHFIPLSYIFRYRFYVLTGGALILTSIVFPLVAPHGPNSPDMLLCTGLILWLNTLRILKTGFNTISF